MRLFLLGATGNTGRQLLELALGRGHEVTAFVRSPQKLTPARSLTVVRGDPRNRIELVAALPHHDAVLSTIGPAMGDVLLRPSTLVTDCANSTIGAMVRTGVKRLAIVSSSLLFPDHGISLAFARWLMNHHLRDLVTMEDAVRASSLEWTIARPPRLKKPEGEGSYHARSGELPPGADSMSCRSLAAFLLDTAEHRSYAFETVGLSS